jgi:ubiquinone/menaquinone biosynthesis C-methylase UbiE
MTSYAAREYTEITDIRDPKKIQTLLSLIPSDVRNIIDIGCGNGLITNQLNEKYEVLGADVNASKLEFVTGPKLQASCDAIPRKDMEFDMVFSSEMLEHLPDDLYARTLQEFARLAKKYILITVPFNEDLHKLLVKCDHCGKVYQKNGHLRSFSKHDLDQSIPGFRTLDTQLYGNSVRKYRKWLADLKHKLTPADSWIPKHWVKTMGVGYHFCIHCGHRNVLRSRFNLLSFMIDSLNTLISGRQRSHLIILMEREA